MAIVTGDPIATSWGVTVPTFANSGDNGKKFQAGVFTITTTAANSANATLTFPAAFGSIPYVVAVADSTLVVGVRVQSRTTTTVLVAIWKTDGTNFSAGSVNVVWMAYG